MRQNPSMRVILAGDFCTRDLSNRLDDTTIYRALQDIQPILDQADVRLINLENPLFESAEPIKKSGPNLRGLPQDIAFLLAGRFDCALLANNHLGDFGAEGVAQTLAVLEQQKLGYAGGGHNIQDGYRAWYTEKNQVALAVLAVAENEFGGAAADKPGMAGLQLGRLMDAIETARQQAQFVIVVVHGGNEYNPLPSPRVVERYRLITRFGADAVIGMHPHCPQGYEIYRGCPIVYSTGNFLFHNSGDTDPRSSWYYGYLPLLTFTPGQDTRLEICPYRFDPDCTAIRPLIGREHEQMLAYLKEISGLFQDPETHAAYFKGWCMITGPSLLKRLQFRPEFLEDPAYAAHKDLLVMRNLFTCEAHNELLTCLLRMIEDKELDLGRRMAAKVKALQCMPV